MFSASRSLTLDDQEVFCPELANPLPKSEAKLFTADGTASDSRQ